MIVYDGTKTEFLDSVINDTIAPTINQKMYETMGRKAGEAEFRSWENSMQHMFKVLSDTSIPNDAGIAIEYNIPQTSKRVDFIITGYDDAEKPNAVIIELKQWDRIREIDGPDALVETYTGGALRPVVHPSYQVWSYAALIRDYNQSVQDGNIHIFPCVYLHNYKEGANDPIRATRYQIYIDEAPIFAYGHVKQMRDFIKKSIVTGDNKEILYTIDHGKIRPSKSLQNAIASMMKGNQEFIMIDEQKVVYESIIQIAEESLKTEKKRTIIVEGGPGTGKSVIAINLLAELTHRGQFVQYVSKNLAPRTVYQKRLKGQIKKSSVDLMFKGSSIYTEAGLNIVHTILADEAHRLNEKDTMRQDKGENQIKEIIHASYCSVFFIDEDQRVTMSDIGSVSEIEKWAKIEGSEIIKMELVSQFRCNGSNGYLAWINNTFEIGDTANFSISDLEFDIKVIDDPIELRRLIVEKNNENHRSRLLAGFCWDWKKEERNNTNYHDIQIGSFSMSWNLRNYVYADDPNSINEVGCIHTSQGLEFDYVGVIIGDDMRFEDDHIVTDFTKRSKDDKSLKGIKKLYKENPDEALARADKIIKNTYRTLLTRGMTGCYIYCTDEKLRKYLKECLSR